MSSKASGFVPVGISLVVGVVIFIAARSYGPPTQIENSVDSAQLHRIDSVIGSNNKLLYVYVNDVTVAQFRKFCNQTGRNFAWDGPYKDWFLGDQWPMTHVTLQEAKDYATWAKCRLPSQAEWQSLASPKGQRFAWGDVFPPPHAAANLAGDELAKEYPTSFEGRVISGYDDGSICLSNVGAFGPDRVTGLTDLIGNVRLWCLSEDGAAVCGASWRTFTEADCEAQNVMTEPADARLDDVGFRCVLDAAE